MKNSQLRLTAMICAALLAGPVSATIQATDPANQEAASETTEQAQTAPAEAEAEAEAPAPAGDEGKAKVSMIDPVCKQLSEDILDALVKGDYVAARIAFNGDMTKQLTQAKLQEAWESLLPRFGAPKMRGEPQGKRSDGLSVIYTPLKFEHGNLVSQVACDGNGKVAGFYVVPEMPPAPAENKKPIEY